MFIETLAGAVALVASGGAAAVGYLKSRDFTSRRLRFVEIARSPAAPWIAGAVAGVAAAPVVALLPIIGGGTALLFGAAVGVGTRAGQRRIENPALED